MELIVEETPWHPLTSSDAGDCARQVGVRLSYSEQALREQVKAAGGRWDAGSRLWHLPLHRVRALGLVERIVTS